MTLLGRILLAVVTTAWMVVSAFGALELLSSCHGLYDIPIGLGFGLPNLHLFVETVHLFLKPSIKGHDLQDVVNRHVRRSL